MKEQKTKFKIKQPDIDYLNPIFKKINKVLGAYGYEFSNLYDADEEVLNCALIKPDYMYILDKIMQKTDFSQIYNGEPNRAIEYFLNKLEASGTFDSPEENSNSNTYILSEGEFIELEQYRDNWNKMFNYISTHPIKQLAESDHVVARMELLDKLLDSKHIADLCEDSAALKQQNLELQTLLNFFDAPTHNKDFIEFTISGRIVSLLREMIRTNKVRISLNNGERNFGDRLDMAVISKNIALEDENLQLIDINITKENTLSSETKESFDNISLLNEVNNLRNGIFSYDSVKVYSNTNSKEECQPKEITIFGNYLNSKENIETVSKEKYDTLKEKHDSLAENFNALKIEADSLIEKIIELKKGEHEHQSIFNDFLEAHKLLDAYIWSPNFTPSETTLPQRIQQLFRELSENNLDIKISKEERHFDCANSCSKENISIPEIVVVPRNEWNDLMNIVKMSKEFCNSQVKDLAEENQKLRAIIKKLTAK